MLLALLLIVTLLTIAGCQPHHRPDYMTRVGEDCAAGDQWACDLLEHHGVLIQPGYFYDFPREAFIVISLLTEPSILEEGLKRIVAAVC